MAGIAQLLARIEEEVRKARIQVDPEPYARGGRDPNAPILFAGGLEAPVAFLARDLGKDEVLEAEPLIGGAGQRVRKGLYRYLTGSEPPMGDVRLAATTSHALLTNTVPYKPLGNKAYPWSVRERFRPYVAELLACHWTGDRLISMGTEAFLWFAPFAAEGVVETFWKRADRYEAELECVLEAECDGQPVRKPVLVAPLPHPSPLNRTYWDVFPEMLKRRLAWAYQSDSAK